MKGMRENMVLYSKTNLLDVDKHFKVGHAKNLSICTDLESRLQRQKYYCFL